MTFCPSKGRNVLTRACRRTPSVLPWERWRQRRGKAADRVQPVGNGEFVAEATVGNRDVPVSFQERGFCLQVSVDSTPLGTVGTEDPV